MKNDVMFAVRIHETARQQPVKTAVNSVNLCVNLWSKTRMVNQRSIRGQPVVN